MLQIPGFHKGINLGGWLSQCDYSPAHLDSFITEPDFARIAGWGFDHVRIPFDYNILETEDGSAYLDAGFARLADAVSLARKYDLNVVLDLHKTAGFSFDTYSESESGFFDSPAFQERFIRLWCEIAGRFGNDPDHIAFELLNEITDRSFLPVWQDVVRRLMPQLRTHAPQTYVLIGSYWNNAAAAVRELDPPYDAHTAYNMHCYEPLKFTHQGAHWTALIRPDERMSFAETGIDETYFETLFASAIAHAQQHNAALYCGEYGVIDFVSPEDTLRWFQTIHAVLERHGIGRAMWTYKSMNFALDRPELDGVRMQLLRNI